MKRVLSLLAMTGVFAALTFGTANASVASTGTFKDGPYTSTSVDSGTCGNNWAIDLFNRNFVVTLPANPDGTYTLTESFSKGHFNTLEGQSPAGCDAGYVDHGTTIAEGVSGKMSGTFTIIVTAGVLNVNGSCVRADDGQCTTAGWVAGFFSDAATYVVPRFNFTYTAKGQGLDFFKWTNADTGNKGDIATG